MNGSASLEILRCTQDDIVSELTYPVPKITKSQNHEITRGGGDVISCYFLSEWCRCGADMKKPRMGSTKAYIPFGGMIEAPQMRRYHKKLLVHRGEELLVVAGEIHLLLQELHSLYGCHIR